MAASESWAGRGETKACCSGLLGAVVSTESVARLRMIRTPPQGYKAFRRSELFPRPGVDFSNVCGEADGLSVDRCDSLSHDALRTRSEHRAGASDERKGNGAVVAVVGAVRSIRLAGSEVFPVFVVYDDATTTNPEHSVIRGSELVPRAFQASLLDELIATFSIDVSAQPTDLL